MESQNSSKMTDVHNKYDPGVPKLLSQLGVASYEETKPSLYDAVDNSAPRPNDRRMTDLTRQEVDAKLAQNKAEVDVRLANFDTSIKTGFSDIGKQMADLRTEMAKQTGDMRTEMANVRADVHKMNADIKTWTIATMLTIIGTMLAAIFGVATIFNNASKAPAAAQGAAPVVYSLPPGSIIQTPAQAPAVAQPAQK